MPKNIVVILGHPDSRSFCKALADTYIASAKASGHEVRFFPLGALSFDPVLRQGYRSEQTMEPDLVSVQDAIRWAQHVVLVYPIWWGAMPALLKGMIDRVFLPGFAFRYRKDSQFWDRLLAGRSAHVITTMDTPPWYYRLIYRMPSHHQIKKTILEFSGIKPVQITSLGPMRYATSERREQWLQRVARYAAIA